MREGLSNLNQDTRSDLTKLFDPKEIIFILVITPGCCAVAQDSGVSKGKALLREAREGDTGPAETGFGGERM